MKRIPRRLPVLLLLLSASLLATGCLKTRITTGQAASNQQAKLEWAHGFVFGLVPPVNAPLNTVEPCGAEGGAEVYFRRSFVQVLAEGLTNNIYSPQRFTATCAVESGTASAWMSPRSLLREVPASDSSGAGPEFPSASARR